MIRSGSKVTPEATIYSIAVIYSYLPYILSYAVACPLLISTSESKVVPRVTGLIDIENASEG